MEKQKQAELLAEKLEEMGVHTEAELQQKLKQNQLDISIFIAGESKAG